MTIAKQKIYIKGTVQGIGFRPFVYREALKYSISGHVLNDSSGVTIEAEGRSEDLENFINTVKTSPPPFAQIHSLIQEELEPSNKTGFKIVKSENLGAADTLISPDIATCNDCLSDITDPANRRYRYPFTNCTNCGPRYTIIEGVPYDRPKTSMKRFRMCSECQREYEDPIDRRFHAQPNACPHCGPQLSLIKNSGTMGKIQNKSKIQSSNEEVILMTTDLLNKGKIVAIKGLGGYHLACNATDEEAVKRLRKRKKRDEKPFAIMMPDVATVRQYCDFNATEESILTSPQRPIVLLRKRTDAKIAEAVAPNNCYLGIMLPYTPLHYLLFQTDQDTTYALVMTSANISDEPICYKDDEARQRLRSIADYFLTHDRDIHIRTDDSIARVMDGRPLIIRRSRGYVPQPVILFPPHPNPLPGGEREIRNHEILAVGAELKNAVCLIKDNKAFISQHIGDLENTASYESFEKTIDHLKEIFDIDPTIIAHDLHPEYFSTNWAKKETERGVKHSGTQAVTHPIQHHHAHIASCMAENRIDRPVIGIALDGTGFGTDGHIWGGELLLATYTDFERVAHFEYLPMPGGEAAIKNPWQMALAYISALVPKCLSALVIKEIAPSFRSIEDAKIELVLNMIEKEINSPLTSSCGRLFDAVAAILGLRQAVTFEGQAALELEMEATMAASPKSKIQNSKQIQNPKSKTYNLSVYPYKINKNKHLYTISYTITVKAILEDLKSGVTRSEIALRFHNTLVAALTEVAVKIGKRRGITDIALSGGCFQNVLLTEKLKKSLETCGFTVYTHSLVPPNDGGISLGQAAIANDKFFF